MKYFIVINIQSLILIILPPFQQRRDDSTDATQTFVLDDTVHYMSPASSISDRTVDEGDYRVYEKYLQLPIFEKPREYSSYSSSTISCEEMELQRTVLIVKPDAMVYEDVVLREVFQVGFTIVDVISFNYFTRQFMFN